MDHYYSADQTSKLRTKKITGCFFSRDFTFITPSAVFSFGKIDNGSALLLTSADVKGHVLDLGCGWGLLGVVISKYFPKTNVVMSDVNKRALLYAKKNLKENQATATVIESDCFENIKDTFDGILVNPPQKAGLQLCYKMITESKDHLNSGGKLFLVARHKIGGKRLMEKMKDVFGNVDTMARKSGFRVYVSKVL